ncbi:hypothetical protein OSB04_008465 [Centaurea solstitialis]|uniref:GDSL esterase/lipase n=1 Tax=Centaurea solstitialis TaxID=347529 RepID=A0AA38TYK1_9ASTR|nr:hypothetical protein OSB04_008465 [Centaurea solstitialis]
MACKISLLFFLLMVLGFIQQVVMLVEPQVPCYFIFGDALVDSGNNNGLVTRAKANYTPYGIDFPQGVTGRFTNGRTYADIVGQLLGFPNFIPPYATVTDEQISTGVNYGSGDSGIREETGSHMGDRFSLSRQLRNHEAIVSRLSSLQRNKTFTNDYLKKCIYNVNIGSDDYINNYLMPNNYNTSKVYTTDQFGEVLVQQYSQQLKTLYNLGARKIAVFSLALIGCTPTEIARFDNKGRPCVESINDAIKPFNDRLKPLVDRLNQENIDASFTLINFTNIVPLETVARLPINVPCCQVREDGQCIPNSIPCLVRALSVFYDGLHPSDTGNIAIAARTYKAISPLDASPYDISHLAKL